MTGTRLAVLALAALASGCISRMPSAPVVDRSPSRAEAKPRVAAPSAAPSRAAPAAPTAAPDGFYVVSRGDTLYSIALEHGADYREIAQWNGLEDATRIRVGQLLRVSPPQDRRIEVGAARIPGRIESRPLDAAAPRAEAPARTAPKAASVAPSRDTEAKAEAAGFVWPAKGKVLAGFSEPRSKGIDIDGKPGDPVVAAAAGRVTYIGTGIPGLGKLVVIKHDNGFITVYAHNRDILVKEQQAVARGEKIAELGSTDADRPKLHFQIRKGSAPVDPMRYLPGL
jgi:lipoprotein NlpD